jgi:hypothetical protein
VNDSPSACRTPKYKIRMDAPAATAAGDPSALADALAALGDEARYDDAFGSDWACWADWCWRAAVPPLPASPATARAFVEDVAAAMPDADDLLDVIAAVGDRHRAAGHPDPFAGCAR